MSPCWIAGQAGTHWVAIFVNDNRAVYFDSFGVEHLPVEIQRFLRKKDIHANIYRIQAYDSILCSYYCIKFLDFMFAGKSLADYTSMFSPTDFKLNDQKILKLFDM